MILKDIMPRLQGTLHFQVFKHGRLIDTYEHHNLITDGGRKKLAAVMAGLENSHIASVGIGNGMEAAAVSDTTLKNQLLIPISKATVTNLTARYDFEIDKDTGNGLNIQEFGLFFDDGTMFSHRVREGNKDLVKSEDIIIAGYWEVDF